MIPSVYVALDAIPMNPTTGKLNHKLLPPPPPQLQSDVDDLQLADIATAAERQTAMKGLWERVLSLESGSVKDDSDFFDFGGHSLLAVKLTGFIEKLYGAELSVKDIYQYPTVNALLDHIDARGDTALPPVSLREEATWSLDMIPAPHVKPLSLHEANAIFLTGATGFLGAFLLDELLRATSEHVRVHCLTRVASGAHDGMARIIDNLKHYDLWRESYASRIVPVEGDLSQKHLGLDADDFDRLAKDIDFIFHAAAFVNYVYPYSILKPHTVEGTQEVLRLAFRSVRKPVYYISTNGVFPTGAPGVYREDQDIDAFADHLTTGYAQTKWVAEKLVWQAASRGLPVCVFRPGNIGHHRVTGAVNLNDFQYHILDACLKIGCAPAHEAWMFEFTPVDFLAQAIVRFAHDAIHFGQVYHVVQTAPVSARVVFDALMQKKHLSRYVSAETWAAQLHAKAKADRDDMLSVIAQSLPDIEAVLTDQNIYDGSRFEAALGKYGLRRPQTDLAYFEPLLQRLTQR